MRVPTAYVVKRDRKAGGHDGKSSEVEEGQAGQEDQESRQEENDDEEIGPPQDRETVGEEGGGTQA
ncbi:MAG TPA: hypothetical protein VEK73_09305 [Xanthobacteraceae bacterium]|nr:hypothetical protein [Xanthobacteraceae bacterium]